MINHGHVSILYDLAFKNEENKFNKSNLKVQKKFLKKVQTH